MVNEVLPRDAPDCARLPIADHIMTQPRTTRRLTTQIVRRPWKQRIVDDLDGGFGIQMFGHVAKQKSIHGEQHIEVDGRLRARRTQEQLRLKREGALVGANSRQRRRAAHPAGEPPFCVGG